MRWRLLLMSIVLIWVVVCSRSVQAEERSLDFLQGLRDRNYFDYAMLYLDQLARRPSLPDEIRQAIPYERAITLRENAKLIRNPEKQLKLLDQAMAYLEQFSRDHPNHPKSGDANSDRAQILLQKADVEILQSKSSANKGQKADFQQRGREFVIKARDVLKLAFDQHEEAVKKFPTFIDPQKDPQLHAERDRVDRSLVLEALALAKCTYLEARTYDPTAREYKPLLNRAADEFETIFNTHNKQVGGLHARLWQGKCFEERGDLTKARGFYDEVLRQEGNDPSLQTLRSQALLFKLGCLQSPENYQTVVDLAEDWLKKNTSESKSQVGLGIQWEQARALEALGDRREQAKVDQERFWRQARTSAQQVNLFAGEYKEVSLAMLQRLQGKLGGKERKPEDFETAYGMQRQAFELAEELRKQLEAGSKSELSAEERARLKQDWLNNLNQAAASFELAMTLANRRETQKRPDPKDVAASRLMQASTNFYMRRNYEAAVLAQYVARTTTGNEDNTALDAAFIVLAAFVQAYNDNKAEPDEKLDDMRLIIKAANQITERWPESERANEARIVLGQTYRSAKKHLEAAEWFSKIPASDSKFPEAQLAAGQAYWSAFGASSRLPKDSRPSTEQFAEWKAASEKHLRAGIEKLAESLPSEGTVPADLAVAKISLAEILLSQGQDADAVRLLRDDPQSIVKAVAVEDEALRPEQGVQRRPIAKLTYILLLRAYIGMGLDKLNDARATMKTLESIVANDSSSDLTDLYVELGRMLKAELERFRNSGETGRVKKLMTAFESFLDDMFKKQDGQTFGSLSWIGETYFALGEMSTDGSRYYDRAAVALGGILSRAQAEPGFATAEQLLNVKVRLVHCNRLKKDFANAEQILTEVMKQRGNDLRTQLEGAAVYQDWGLSGDNQKFIVAITGNKELGLWGWGGIAKRIQQQKDFTERPELVATFLDARYSVSLCRFYFAKSLAPAEKKKELDRCALELVSSSVIMKTMPEEQREKLNQLYRDVLRESGKTVTNLPHSETDVAQASKDTDGKEETPAGPEKQSTTRPNGGRAEVASKGFDTVIWIAFGGCLAAGGSVAAWVFLTGRKTKPKAKSFGRSKAAVSFTGIAVEESRPADFPPPSAATKPRPRPAAGGAVPNAGSPSTVKRPATRGDASGTPPVRPRPRPPAPPADE